MQKPLVAFLTWTTTDDDQFLEQEWSWYWYANWPATYPPEVGRFDATSLFMLKLFGLPVKNRNERRYIVKFQDGMMGTIETDIGYKGKNDPVIWQVFGEPEFGKRISKIVKQQHGYKIQVNLPKNVYLIKRHTNESMLALDIKPIVLSDKHTINYIARLDGNGELHGHTALPIKTQQVVDIFGQPLQARGPLKIWYIQWPDNQQVGYILCVGIEGLCSIYGQTTEFVDRIKTMIKHNSKTFAVKTNVLFPKTS